MKIKLLGIDLAKNVFQLCALNQANKVLFNRTVRRAQLEVPILEGLIGNGMGSGPALALLLAGPALSLPSILVVRSVVGWKKTLVYVALVAVAATASGLVYGALA